MSIEALLYDEIETDFEKLRGLDLGSKEHQTGVASLTALMDRAIEMDKIENECKAKAAAQEEERKLKEQELADEKKDRLIKNIMNAAGILLPILVTIWGTKASLKFEETGTVTTIMGRGFIQKLLPKK